MGIHESGIYIFVPGGADIFVPGGTDIFVPGGADIFTLGNNQNNLLSIIFFLDFYKSLAP